MRRFLFVLAASLCFLQAHTFAQTPNLALKSEQKILKARPLPLNSVRLTGGPLKTAQELDAQYLLQLEPDRMLAYLRQRAELAPRAKGYGGWDGGGRQLTGHIAGHYLSAVSLMWAATGDVRFKEQADYIVSELKEIQDAQKDGYIGAQMDGQGVDGKVRFQDLCNGIIRSGGFDLNGLWSPWYVEHKIFAGLRDAYRYTGNRTALDVEIKFAGWVESILAKLDDEQIQKMLATEFGGMNEVLAELTRGTHEFAPVLVGNAQPVENWLKPVSDKQGTFETTGVGLSSDITFVPFYQLPRRKYAIYWDMYTREEWKKRSEAYAAEQEKQKKIEAATVAFVQPGQMQTERDFNEQGEDTSPVQLQERYGRRGTKWFSFDVPVDSAHPMSLVVTFSNDARRKGSFDVLVEGKKVGEQATERRSPQQDIRFFDVEYAIPAELIENKRKITVRFEASSGNEISGVFGIRTVRADAER